MVAFGNTLPHAREQTHGLEERGAAADGVWRPRAGVGHVQKCRGQYTHAGIANGCSGVSGESDTREGSEWLSVKVLGGVAAPGATGGVASPGRWGTAAPSAIVAAGLST